ncbi:MAG: secretin N-terminal domain-containing protein [candidate division WOR-3 bacterium]
MKSPKYMLQSLKFAGALFICLFGIMRAQEPTVVQDIAVDKLLEGVRVSVACSRTPNVSSFVSDEPPAIVLDIMNAVSRLAKDRVASEYYPVSAVTVGPSEAANGVRITIRLRDMVDHKVSTENGTVVVDLGTEPVRPMPVVESKDPFAGKRLTLIVKDADIADIVRMIAQQFDLNILTTQDVKSLVSVRLNDVPLRIGLEALLKAALCNMVEDGHGLIVVKPLKKEMYGETETRVFHLDYVEASDAIKAIAKVLSPSGNAVEGYQRITKGGGAEERSGVLVVTDLPEAMARVAQVIAELDQPVAQISIEAKFVETTRSAEERYGIDWHLVATATTQPPRIGEEMAFPIIFNELLLGKLSLEQLSASLELMMSRGKSRVLANPRLVTLDNQTAEVSMGLDVPVREVHKDPNTGEITYTWRTRSIPIKMEVTPHVTSDGMVTMRVKPSVEAITGWVGTADDRQPIVAKRSAETQVKVADGEVVVIGGLVKDEETHNVGKVPFLGDIPILGHLFKKTSVQHTKSDLMIFIIPHVLPASGGS